MARLKKRKDSRFCERSLTLRYIDEDLRDDITDHFRVVQSSRFAPWLGQRFGVIEDLEEVGDQFGGGGAARNSDAEDRLQARQDLVLGHFVAGTGTIDKTTFEDERKKV